MGIIKLIFAKVLSHPAWTGIGTLVAVIALFVTLYSGNNNSANDVPTKESQTIADTTKQHATRKFISQRVALLIGISDYDGDEK